jgi:Uma2 family endonuclease
MKISISEKAFLKQVLADPSGGWELHYGALRQKPPMTMEHNYLQSRAGALLSRQLDLDLYQVRQNAGHARVASDRYYIPDVFVVPMEYVREGRHRPDVVDAHSAPLPLVIEIWSPSTGGYDVSAKLPQYQQRGDQEIWYLHPYDRTLTRWLRQPDGSYQESVHEHGVIEPVALPGVQIDLDFLFA